MACAVILTYEKVVNKNCVKACYCSKFKNRVVEECKRQLSSHYSLICTFFIFIFDAFEVVAHIYKQYIKHSPAPTPVAAIQWRERLRLGRLALKELS